MNAVAEACRDLWLLRDDPFQLKHGQTQILIQARPENPVEWLAYYLLKNNTAGHWLIDHFDSFS